MKLKSLVGSLFTATALSAVSMSLLTPVAFAENDKNVTRAVVPNGAIEHILVIDLENENYSATFGPTSPAVYLNTTLLSQGQLIPNYFGTSHVSAGNYIAQVSGQGPTVAINNDCLDLSSLTSTHIVGGFKDVVPGLDDPDQLSHPGQVKGDGCVFPAPSQGNQGVITIGDQLDAKFSHDKNEKHDKDEKDHRLNWRSYAEDMGNNVVRDYGTPDSMGGTTCAHPPVDGVDNSNSAVSDDQYATRHNPFVYFHSVIDDQERCDSHVVPLGAISVGQNGEPDSFSGHLHQDLSRIETTPKFMFVSPNLCNDGHDATCAGPNVEGTKNAAGKNIGGLVSADLWLKHWMPMIFNSPAYQSGKMLVVVTFDESGFSDSRACPLANQADCAAPTGPNVSNFGFSQVLGLFKAQKPPTSNIELLGGGQVGAVVFNKRYIQPGSVNTTGYYNHFSALRSYEDMLGLHEGGDDGLGHLGYAAKTGQVPFGADVFNKKPKKDQD
jgi:hypothetical protein